MPHPQITELECTILINTSISDSVDLEGARLVGILMPAVWDAATVSFEGSDDDSSFFEVGDGTAEISLTAAGGWIVAIPRGTLDGVGKFVKIRSGTSVAPVNQTAERTVTLLVRP